MVTAATAGHAWWQKGVIYQVYPRSFQDADGDGVGDLGGVLARLDYLAWLGVDALWLSPIQPSPMADFGYDISDFTAIDPLFGTMDDFDRLVAEAHARGLKVILDFVPNHTSDQHPWFVESRSSRTNPKRDWYIWRPLAADGGPPNNWLSNFGGSAWEFDAHTGEYFHHAFLKEQPDLNWRNAAVREAMHDVLRFWLARGVDGFRVDVIWHLIKDDQFRDNPPNPAWRTDQPSIERLLQVWSADRPEVQEVVAGLRRVIDEWPDRVLIGEIYLPIERLIAYYGIELGGAHLPFNFQLISAAWSAPVIERLIREYENALPPGAWPNWVLGNHDQRRIASRVGGDQARVAAMLLLTLRGTPTLYYGDEIGMENVPIPPGQARDPWELNEPGLGLGRDPARTPMQWSEAWAGGFTASHPWLPIAADYQTRNVAVQSQNSRSMLSLHRRLIQLRRGHSALSVGGITAIEAVGDVLSYVRYLESERLFVVLNLSRKAQRVTLPAETPCGTVLITTCLDRDGDRVGIDVELRPSEGAVIALARP